MATFVGRVFVASVLALLAIAIYFGIRKLIAKLRNKTFGSPWKTVFSVYFRKVIPVVTLMVTCFHIFVYGICTFFGMMGSGGPMPTLNSCTDVLGYSVVDLILLGAGIVTLSYLVGRFLEGERTHSA